MMSRKCVCFGFTYIKTVGIILIFFLCYKYASFHFMYQMHYCTVHILIIVCYFEYTHMNTFVHLLLKTLLIHQRTTRHPYYPDGTTVRPNTNTSPVKLVNSTKMEFTDRDQLHKIPVEIWLIPGRDQYIVSPISLLYRHTPWRRQILTHVPLRTHVGGRPISVA